MSIADYSQANFVAYKKGDMKSKDKSVFDINENEKSNYQPTDKEKETLFKILKDFQQAYMNLQTPRREFNDLSLVQRAERDKLQFNNYITNDGEYALSDVLQSWRSRAQRPVLRDKIIAICAAATQRLIFPKIMAFDENNNLIREGADLMEKINIKVQEKADYEYKSFLTTLTALWSPASIIYTGYEKKQQKVKTRKVNGEWEFDWVDTQDTGIQASTVPVEELLLADFYTHDVQDQDFVMWRRTPTYSQAAAKYQEFPNFQYVRKGMQCVYADNLTIWYNLYDPNLRQELVEEIIYWNKREDLFAVVVNGILMTEYDEPNPRIDKKYPFAKTGYEPIDEGRFFYYKSLAAKLYQDAKLLNRTYQIINDGSYLNAMPPLIATGGETVGSDVIVPGVVTTFQNPQATVTPIRTSQDLQSSFKVLDTIEASMGASAREPVENQVTQGLTATEIEVREKQATQIIGMFIKMIVKYVKDYGELSISNIVQYVAVPDEKGKYASFTLLEQMTDSGAKDMKIEFAKELLTPMMPEEIEAKSMQIWKEEKDLEMEIIKVNPKKFKELRFELFINPDIAMPLSESGEGAFKLELYREAMQNPILDQTKITKKFLLGAYPQTKSNPDDFILKGDTLNTQQGIPNVNMPVAK